MRLMHLLRPWVMACLLLTLPALGMAGHMPCGEGQEQSTHMHHAQGGAGHGHHVDNDHHDVGHHVAQHHCCDNAGSCCMGMATHANPSTAIFTAGQVRTAFSVPLIVPIIPETPQRPPNTLSA